MTSQIIWAAVFQYCVIKVLLTIVTVITAAVGDRYCRHSLSPQFAHLWVTIGSMVSVTFAMYCLVQFYTEVREDILENRPFLKILSIKLVVFFSFWQSTIIGFLSSEHGPLKATSKLNYPDIFIGIPSILLFIEMAVFAVLHLFSFSWKPYTLRHKPNSNMLQYQGGLLGWKALMDAFNPWDIIKAIARGLRLAMCGARTKTTDMSSSTVTLVDRTSEGAVKMESVVTSSRISM